MISIIIATKNCAEELRRCLDSIRVQSTRNFQIVISDGASSDGTVDVIKANLDIVDHWFSEKDTGVYAAWNRALQHARGEWLYFLGGDDQFYGPDTLANVSRLLALQTQETVIAYGNVAYPRPDGSEKIVGDSWDIAIEWLAIKMPIPHQGAFHRAKVFSRDPPFCEDYFVAGDYELLLYANSMGNIVSLPNIIVAKQGLAGMSSLRKNRLRVIREYRKAQVAHGLPISLGWVLMYLKAWFWRIATAIS